MAYATQVGRHKRPIFDRSMAYLKALLMVDSGYREVTVRDHRDDMEAKIIRRANGSIEVWTPAACTAPLKHEEGCCCHKWAISRFVGTLMPMYHQMKPAIASA